MIKLVPLSATVLKSTLNIFVHPFKYLSLRAKIFADSFTFTLIKRTKTIFKILDLGKKLKYFSEAVRIEQYKKIIF